MLQTNLCCVNLTRSTSGSSGWHGDPEYVAVSLDHTTQAERRVERRAE